MSPALPRSELCLQSTGPSHHRRRNDRPPSSTSEPLRVDGPSLTLRLPKRGKRRHRRARPRALCHRTPAGKGSKRQPERPPAQPPEETGALRTHRTPPSGDPITLPLSPQNPTPPHTSVPGFREQSWMPGGMGPGHLSTAATPERSFPRALAWSADSGREGSVGRTRGRSPYPRVLCPPHPGMLGSSSRPRQAASGGATALSSVWLPTATRSF